MQKTIKIPVKLVKEEYTSSVCPFCGTKGRRITRGLFYCPKCNQIMNADVVGCFNIAKKCKAIIPTPAGVGITGAGTPRSPPFRRTANLSIGNPRPLGRGGCQRIVGDINFFYLKAVKLL